MSLSPPQPLPPARLPELAPLFGSSPVACLTCRAPHFDSTLA